MAAQTTPDLSEFEALARRSTKKPCQLGAPIAALSTVEREQLAAACATDRTILPATAIVKWLKSRGHDVGMQAVAYHRRGECSCAQ